MAFHMVSSDFWQDTEDWSSDERSMAIYLLTCPHRTKEGLFRLLPAYVSAELRFERERALETFDALAARGWVKYDRAGKVMFLCKSLRWFPPKGPKSIAGACSAVAELRGTVLFGDFAEAAREWAPELFAAIVDRGWMPLPQSGMPHPATPDAPSAVGYPEAPSGIRDGASESGGPEENRSDPEQINISTAAREPASWFQQCVEAGQAQGLRWASNLPQLAEYGMRADDLLRQCDDDVARGVRRDILDAVRAGKVHNDFPESVRSFIGNAERRAKNVGTLPRNLMSPTTPDNEYAGIGEDV